MSCYINERISEESKCESGFMGRTHALSAVSIFLVLMAFFPKESITILGVSTIPLLLLAMINMTGASLAVDLDNTQSTSKSSLGIVGDLLSLVYRGTSTVIQTVIRSPRDDSTPNPHRGFYHTTVAAILLGFLTYSLTKIETGGIVLPFLGEITIGYGIALILSWMNLHMALAGLAREVIRKIKKAGGVFGEVIAFALSLSIIYLLFSQVPKDQDFIWLGVSIAAGSFIHSIGDAFTKYGSPLLWPLPIKGKLWFNIRFMKIKSGGTIENVLFIPFFLIVSVIAFVKIILSI